MRAGLARRRVRGGRVRRLQRPRRVHGGADGGAQGGIRGGDARGQGCGWTRGTWPSLDPPAPSAKPGEGDGNSKRGVLHLLLRASRHHHALRVRLLSGLAGRRLRRGHLPRLLGPRRALPCTSRAPRPHLARTSPAEPSISPPLPQATACTARARAMWAGAASTARRTPAPTTAVGCAAAGASAGCACVRPTARERRASSTRAPRPPAISRAHLSRTRPPSGPLPYDGPLRRACSCARSREPAVYGLSCGGPTRGTCAHGERAAARTTGR